MGSTPTLVGMRRRPRFTADVLALSNRERNALARVPPSATALVGSFLKEPHMNETVATHPTRPPADRATQPHRTRVEDTRLEFTFGKEPLP
jgi:hypothetical protein